MLVLVLLLGCVVVWKVLIVQLAIRLGGIMLRAMLPC